MRHRKGSLKQTNKSHKTGRHRSKGAIDNALKGKVSLSVISRKRKMISKSQRRNKLLQTRKMKIDDIITLKRQVGRHTSAPFLVCILPMHLNVDPKSVLSILTNCSKDAIICDFNGVTYVNIQKFKQHFAFVIPPIGNEIQVLDYLKVCDTTLLIISAITADDPFDNWGHRIFQMILAQGIPSPIAVLMDIESISHARRQVTKTAAQKFIGKVLPNAKLSMLGSNSEGVTLLRRIGNQKQNSLSNRDNRPNLFGDKVEYITNPDDENSGTLKVYGFVRGTPLNINGLVHVLGIGDYQMQQIDVYESVYELNVNDNKNKRVRLTMVVDKSKQLSLQCENNFIVDSQDHTHFLETELIHPGGTIDQMIKGKESTEVEDGKDDFDLKENNSVSQSDNDEYMSCDNDSSSTTSDKYIENVESASVSDTEVNDEKYDLQMDIEEERETLLKLKEARNDKIWPDEIDTPMDVPARERFQKYRGLESFRTSPWNPKENLPIEYSRIFQFQNFERTRKRVIKEAKEVEGASPGMYICVHISNIPKWKWLAYKSDTQTENLIVYGVLPYEHQMSVVNVILKRVPTSTIPIKSKEQLLIQCGYRRFSVNPIFSQHSNGDRHKFERFFQPGSVVCATFFAPIQFPPASVLAFKMNPNSKFSLVARGFLLSCNPDRIILKRICLSGHPARIHRKVATIRYMFFNKEDVEYFKPVKLRTKCGRVGHIKESLGTHGHMKCYFDGHLLSHDTIFMFLYKRIYPKWNYNDQFIEWNKIQNRDATEK